MNTADIFSLFFFAYIFSIIIEEVFNMKPKQKENLVNLFWSLWIPEIFIAIGIIVYELIRLRFG